MKRATAGVGSASLVALGFFALAPQANAAQDAPVACLSAAADVSAAVSYTFDAATASGTVTVSGTVGLCKPLIVRAATYAFTTTWSQWPQTLVGFNDVIVQAPGTYHYAAPAASCRQSDLYAGWTTADVALPSTLTGSGQPFEPGFIWNIAHYGGTPFTVDSVPCTPLTTTTPPPPTTSSPAPTTSSPAPTTSSPAPTTTSPTGTTSPPVVTTTAPTPVVSGTSATNTTSATATTTTAAPTTTTPGASVSGVSETNTPTATATPTTPSVLPFTGGNVGTVAGFGALGILAGLALMVATRKPRRQ
jgi:hypothetical protein